jgi:hypothetical protein
MTLPVDSVRVAGYRDGHPVTVTITLDRDGCVWYHRPTMTKTATTPRSAPPLIYSTYSTFERVMDQFQQRGVPPAVEVSAISAVPSDTARRLIAGFRAIGWIDMDGVASGELRAMVKARNTAEWQQTLRGTLRNVYSFLPAEWERLTAARLSTAFREHTGRDDYVTKGAQTFFLAAALDAGVTLTSELAARATKAQRDFSANLRFRKNPSKPRHDGDPGRPAGRTNGAAKQHTDAEMAQVWNLLGDIDDAEMTDKERSAALTFFAYLRRRADRKRGPRA